ncbi:LLM class flavin-dependent oxidoreductase [Homoserinimonas hongtaonis]|uniref:LLM class flavin-dependent oxidoreductase n=1 Tax=Homoserinimonas hongtaonis TaxID=2079791 RepID=A0A2U1SXV1_9MICO|nr:LLM class flavin-dependent oxidoreductase [Salinibacterium hongtaonis]PWB96418.1 LLM class flavin-dependent oxidoreductase [Salinibacterium hongtaonis]
MTSSAASAPLALSVLDLVPVRTNQTTSDAIAASVTLARTADRLGFRRYWLAEHHNMPAVASTNPAVLIGILAANTERIRVGSGGVMLPNHVPLVVAEQFAILEAAYPGRIDLGIGRAPGSDPVITSLLRSTGTTSDVDEFERNVLDIGALMDPTGASLRMRSGQLYSITATPHAVSVPELWLLGSSDYSAKLAARLGLPYVFAHHFSGQGTRGILDLYRTGFTPAAPEGEDSAERGLQHPRTFLTLNVSVAETAKEAQAAALPNLQRMAMLMTGSPLLPLSTIEEAAATEVTPAQQHIIDGMLERWVIGDPATVARRIRELAAEFAVDEVMLSVGMSAHAGDPAGATPLREGALQMLADELAPLA